MKRKSKIKYCHKTDPEAQKIYNWEFNFVHTLMNRETISLSKCQEIVNKVCKSFNVPSVLVKDGRGYHCGRFSIRKGKRSIHLPKKWRTNHAVLHEIAHYISDFCDPDNKTGTHGSVFARNAINLYLKYMKIKDPHFSKSPRIFKECFIENTQKMYEIKIAKKNEYPFPSILINSIKLIKDYCNENNTIGTLT